MSDYENFIGRVKELSLIGSLTGIMGWDQETMMPPKGGKLRSEIIEFPRAGKISNFHAHGNPGL